MKQLEKLPEITEKALGGLTADQALKQRILDQAAAQQKVVPLRRKPIPQWVGGAVAAAVVLTIGLTFGIPALTKTPAPSQQEIVTAVRSIDAEESIATAQLLDAAILENESTETATQDSILMITRKAGSGTKGRERADLGNGSITLQTNSSSPKYRSIWEEASSGSFPLLCVDGRCYRMLTSPDSVPDSLLGSSLGSVTTYTNEPALAGSSGIVSNTAAEGETVYGIKKMSGTLVAASVDGRMRLFQRVSFNGTALRGNDALSDTLQLAGNISGMELSGVGTITDSAVCETLFATLIQNASYESSGSVSGKQSLLIQLNNGLVVQLAVKDDRFAACGVWSCPEFFEAFQNQVK